MTTRAARFKISVMSLKPTNELTESQEQTLRLERIHKLHADLDAALASVDRHREELARIKREAAVLTASIVATDEKKAIT